MKDYFDVVQERYEKENLEDVLSNPYQIINPLGFKGCLSELILMRKFVIFLSKSLNKSPQDLRLLDVGCGKGYILRVLAEICGNTNNIFGTELSKNRIEYNKRLNSNISVKYADICHDIPFDFYFDSILAFDVFMHLKTKDQIINSTFAFEI